MGVAMRRLGQRLRDVSLERAFITLAVGREQVPTPKSNCS